MIFKPYFKNLIVVMVLGYFIQFPTSNIEPLNVRSAEANYLSINLQRFLNHICRTKIFPPDGYK